MYFENLISSHKIDTKRLITALRVEDDLGAVIRCHYEAERTMDYVIETITEGRSKNTNILRYFGQKIELLYIIGISDQFLSPLRTINSIRNGFAHKGREEIPLEALANLRDSVQTFSEHPIDDFTVRIDGGSVFEARYDAMTARQKFTVCATWAIGMLATVPDVYDQAAAKNTKSPS